MNKGFSFIEILVAAGILVLVLTIGFMHFRQGRPQASNVAGQFSFHMEVRAATDKLTEKLLDGTEVVKPLPGYSLDHLFAKNITNQLQIFYLEKAAKKSDEPYQMVLYTDDYSGTPNPNQRQVLFGKVKSVLFTPISPGLVTVLLVFQDSSGKELTSIIQIPLKNLPTLDG